MGDSRHRQSVPPPVECLARAGMPALALNEPALRVSACSLIGAPPVRPSATLAGPLDIGAGLAGSRVAISSQALDSMVGVVKRLCYNGHARRRPATVGFHSATSTVASQAALKQCPHPVSLLIESERW